MEFVHRFLGKPTVPRAPPVDTFREVMNAFHKGIAPEAGYELPSGAIIRRDKVRRLLYALGEALRHMKQQWVRNAVVMNIMRLVEPENS